MLTHITTPIQQKVTKALGVNQILMNAPLRPAYITRYVMTTRMG